MTREEILGMNTSVVSKEVFNEIFESEDVMNFQNAGRSGLKEGYTWLIVTLNDGVEVHLYSNEI